MSISKNNTGWIIFGIFIVAAISMTASIWGPAVADMYGAYGDHIPALNYFISGSGIFNMATMLLCPFMEKKVGTKPLFVTGIWLLAVSGAAGIFSFDIRCQCIAQTINACGYGITGTMALSVLMRVITDDKKRGFFNGIYQVIIAGAGSLFAVAGGILAASSWQRALSATWWVCCVLGILAAVIMMKMLPKDVEAEEERQAGDSGPAPWGAVALIFFAFLMIGIAYQYINLMMSVYVEENELGTAVFTGNMQALGTIGSAVMCACFGILYTKFRRKIILAALAVFTVFSFCLYLYPSAAVTAAASLLMGAAFGCSVTFFYTICPEIAPRHMTLLIAWVGVALNVPYLAVSYLYTGLSAVFGSMTSSLVVMSVLLAVEFVLACFVVFRKRNGS